MIDFDSVLETEGTTRRVVSVTTTVPTVTERVTIRPVQVQTAHVVRTTDQWTWQDLRDYVVGQIEKYHPGTQLRDPIKEASIFKSFLGRWGTDAGRIAKHAFEVERAMWHSAPISVNHFCKNSDHFFAAKIMAKLAG